MFGRNQGPGILWPVRELSVAACQCSLPLSPHDYGLLLTSNMGRVAGLFCRSGISGTCRNFEKKSCTALTSLSIPCSVTRGDFCRSAFNTRTVQGKPAVRAVRLSGGGWRLARSSQVQPNQLSARRLAKRWAVRSSPALRQANIARS